uniref:YqaJ viral recombinase domain-containing protein n=1 Tax=Oreochromis aureus TaxID=47969 RepID=A0AAZ1XLR1_OREAU
MYHGNNRSDTQYSARTIYHLCKATHLLYILSSQTCFSALTVSGKSLHAPQPKASSALASCPPKSLLRIFDPQLKGCQLSVLLQHCERLKHCVVVSKAEAEALEEKTREQHKCDLWHTARAGRITASNIHAVVSTSTASPALSTVKKVCYPQNCHISSPTKNLVHLTGKVQHRELKVDKCGFIINPAFPELGCVEIKCPYKHRNNNLLQACEDDRFCLGLKDGRVELKKTHIYYKQVQTQIYVTKSHFCDIVVWTTKACVVTRVMPDIDLWTKMLPFYMLLSKLTGQRQNNIPLCIIISFC